MKNIPLIIPVFNQLTYLKNIITWFKWYYPENPIYVIDNASDYKPLLRYYKYTSDDFQVITMQHNNCADNLREVVEHVIKRNCDYYCISDPDIMPHPSTPSNFLEVFKAAIEQHDFNHAGFQLIYNDIPLFNEDRGEIIFNETNLEEYAERSNVMDYNGYQAPLDTTFGMYKASDGWEAPMPNTKWDNCLRILRAYHLGWYIDPNNINPEMQHYFSTAKFRDLGPVSAGKNNYRPNQYK